VSAAATPSLRTAPRNRSPASSSPDASRLLDAYNAKPLQSVRARMESRRMALQHSPQQRTAFGRMHGRVVAPPVDGMSTPV
jgi:hypothetical protein